MLRSRTLCRWWVDSMANPNIRGDRQQSGRYRASCSGQRRIQKRPFIDGDRTASPQAVCRPGGIGCEVHHGPQEECASPHLPLGAGFWRERELPPIAGRIVRGRSVGQSWLGLEPLRMGPQHAEPADEER